MRILYGVVGEGMGHAIRSRVVLEHLCASGHEVTIMASSRAADYLDRHFESVKRIHGLHIITEENEVRRGRTFWSNLQKGTPRLPQQVRAYFQVTQSFRPEAVISDFESWTGAYAAMHALPLFSIDNMQIIQRCSHDGGVIRGERVNFGVARTLVRGKLPPCDHYFVTTFFYPPVQDDRATLHPPLLRPEILGAQPTRGDHLLVYQTAEGHQALAEALVRTGLECRIYGMRRGITEEQVEGNLRYLPFDEERFIVDLASARGVIAGGGFTVLSECVYLRKPVLSIPISGQFEQVMNGRYLELLGFGMAAREAGPEALRRFLQILPACEERLAGYRQDGNRDLLGALDRKLSELVRSR